VIDLTERVGSTDAEKGLLGIAVSPEGDQLYASYTEASNGGSRIDAYALSGSDGSMQADPSTRRELVAIEQPYPNHKGGRLVVGPHGMLYAGFGDGGSADDPGGRAQDPSTLLGKVLRLDPEGRADADGDGVPDDNPFVAPDAPFEAEPEILLTGVRNPWRMAFDPDTGDLWIADVGQNEEEEINRLSPEGATPAGAGANLGWDLFEGTREFGSPDPADGAASAGPFTTPVFTYSHDEGCSVTGGQVYRGAGIPGLDGAYLFSDFCNPAVRAVRAGDDGTFGELDLGLEAAGAVAAFGRGPDGEIYVVSLDAGVSRIEPA
jgi:glucose/arabinose dehydrogenase